MDNVKEYDLDDLLGELDSQPSDEAIEDDLLDYGDVLSTEFVEALVAKCIVFMEVLTGVKLFPYQTSFAARVFESVIIGDGEELTALFSRQSGKSETVACVVSTLMVLMPRLAKVFPDLLGKFKDGIWIGIFAPVEEQALTLFSRITSRITSDHAVEVMLDPEIDDKPVGGGKYLELSKSGSFVRMQTANPRANIESKSYHFIVIDEAQAADEFVIRKSIHPMLAFYNGTVVKIGTPTVTKGDFYKAIQNNKRRQTKRGARQNHFQADWRECAKYNPNYAKFIKKEMIRIGEDSDEFQLSYALRWLLERGMFVTTTRLDELGDKSMETIKEWWKSPVVVGIDPARKLDSTVVTVCWVDWSWQDEFGYYDHRILNWMEMHGEDWEEQYFRIVDFLRQYNVFAIGVDSQGVGDAVAQRLSVLMPRTEVVALPSDRKTQHERWTHLMELIQRGLVSWPAHAKTRRLKTWQRFNQQMSDLEKVYKGPYMLAAAPEVKDAHDDYPDSLALATYLTKDFTMPTVEVSRNPLFESRRR